MTMTRFDFLFRPFLALGGVLLLGAPVFAQAAPKDTLIFHSGFESGTQIVDNKNITGIDTSVTPPGNWDEPIAWGLTGVPNNDPAERLFEIVPDPAGGTNKVLKTTHFKTAKGVTKTEIGRWGTKGLWGDEMYCKFRIRLDKKFGLVANDPRFDGNFGRFFILTEFWVKAFPYPEDRLSLRLTKKDGQLIWLFDKSNNIPKPDRPGRFAYWREWGIEGDPVQYDTWYTMELYVKLGGEDTGIAWMRYQPDGGQPREFVKWAHTRSDQHPLGVINGVVACKLYFDAKTLAYLDGVAPGGLTIYYDDWELRSAFPGKLPGDPRPPSQTVVLEAESFFPDRFSTNVPPNFVTAKKGADMFVSKGSFVEVIGRDETNSATFDFGNLKPGKYRIEPVFYLKNDCEAIKADWNGEERGVLNLNYGVTGQITKFDLGEMEITAKGPNKLTFSNIPARQRLRVDRFFVTPISTP